MSERHRDPSSAAADRIGMSRRAFLGRAGRGAALMLGSSLLAACEPDAATPSPIGAASASPSADVDWEAWWATQRQTGRFNFANWPYYIDVRGNRRPSLDLFTEETGIHARYYRPIKDNAGFMDSIQPYLEADLPLFYDLIVMTNGPEVDRLIASGWLTPLDHSRLVRFREHASDLVRDPVWDPGNRFSVAWQSGLTGIAFRPEAEEALGRRPDSIRDLFDPVFEGRVGMMSDPLDLGGAGLLALEIEPATSTEDDWRRAADGLRQQRGDGLVRGYYGQSYLGALQRGDTWISQAWSGDIFQAQQLGRDLSFVVPREGALLWTDNMLIPANARHPLDAMTYIDFVYRPEIAAMIADWVWYICPVPEARAIIADRFGHPEVAQSQLVFPDEETMGESMKRYPVFDGEEAAESFESIFGAVSFGL
ncbi:MAG TPA: spermidine/putrescine ABC transporter substrate-binding protein [Actinomycetota bacterium]